HSSNESQTNDKPNLCRRVQGATVRGENLTKRRGSSLDRDEVNSMITPIGCDKKLHSELQQCHSFQSE
ncbi:hypothetical protein MUP77_25110, partial [Candidatus Bathyarchaeota archaeon]|nr:hypothetical protein [Candidatus Bathyarchaeota archaeon]